jgi:hypothetical protein
MKQYVLLLFITLVPELGAQVVAEDRGRYQYPMEPQAARMQVDMHQLWSETTHSKILARVKLALINGQLFQAKTLLLSLLHISDYTKIIAHRYWAIISFLEGDYKKSLSYLDDPKFYQTGHFQHICMLKTMNYLVLNRYSEASYSWRECYGSNQKDIANPLWADVLLTLKSNSKKLENNFVGLNITTLEIDQLELMLKLSLYLNVGSKLISQFELLDVEVLKDERIRELIGLIYYRNNNKKLAFEFLEDLETANAELIKGNIYLSQNKKELALAQYRLTLKRKANSLNAIERILPLAWSLKQWDTAAESLAKFMAIQGQDPTAMSLMLAIEIMRDKTDKANQIINQLELFSESARWNPVAFMKSYLNLMAKNYLRAKRYAFQSCFDANPVMCWNYAQLISHPEIIENAKSKKQQTLHDTIDSLEEYFQSENPIDEKVYISQKEVEELDDSLLRLNQ